MCQAIFFCQYSFQSTFPPIPHMFFFGKGECSLTLFMDAFIFYFLFLNSHHSSDTDSNTDVTKVNSEGSPMPVKWGNNTAYLTEVVLGQIFLRLSDVRVISTIGKTYK